MMYNEIIEQHKSIEEMITMQKYAILVQRTPVSGNDYVRFEEAPGSWSVKVWDTLREANEAADAISQETPDKKPIVVHW